MILRSFIIIFSILLANIVTADDTKYKIIDQNGFIILSNGNNIELAISPKHGGELTSYKIKHKKEWHELIYRAKDYTKQKGWRGKAWLLWPATGPSKLDNIPLNANKIGHYQVNNTITPMPMHGFAKDMFWTVDSITVNKDGASVTLSIEDTPSTLQYYPFGFKLSVTYQLTNNNLAINYRVSAKEKNPNAMPFSIGNHITFNTPLIKNSKASDFSFTTTSDLQLERTKGLPTGKTRPSKFIKPTAIKQLPEKKSISLLSSKEKASLTLTDTSGLKININHTASLLPKNLYIDFNLWGSSEDGFFSPEPWVGAQNSLNSGLGLTKLNPNEQWQWNINISLIKNNH